MRLRIAHTTRYGFETPVPYALQRVRMCPRSHAGQTVEHWQVWVEGSRLQVTFDDQYGNEVRLLRLDPGRSEVTVRCEGTVVTRDTAGVVGDHRGYAPLWLFLRGTDLTRLGPGLRRFLRGLPPPQEDALGTLHALAAAIGGAVRYETGHTDPGTTAEAALEAGHGVCQDHTHIFLAAARALGFPSRYVSGYLMMNDRVEQDAGHAWAEAHVAGLGWVGFDVSNRISPDARYVRVACGLDYRDASPLSGLTFGAGAESMIVSIQVQQ